MAKPLNDRIAAALSNDRSRTSDLEALIAEGGAEIEALSVAAGMATADSMDYTLTDDAREGAAVSAERSKRTSIALKAALDRLTEQLVERRGIEAAKAAESNRDAILAERDRLAETLRQDWPALERRMVELLVAIEANDAAMIAARINEPSAEALARGIPGPFRHNGIALARLGSVNLPSFADGMRNAWPMPQQFTGGAIDYGAIYTESKKRQKMADAAEKASWHPYRIQATSRVAFWTRIMAKHSLDQEHPDAVDIYNHNPIEMYGEHDRVKRELYLKSEVAKSLEVFGFTVELLDTIDQAA